MMQQDIRTNNRNNFLGRVDHAWYNPKRWIYFSNPKSWPFNIIRKKLVLGAGALLLTSYFATEYFLYDMANNKFLVNLVISGFIPIPNSPMYLDPLSVSSITLRNFSFLSAVAFMHFPSLNSA